MKDLLFGDCAGAMLLPCGISPEPDETLTRLRNVDMTSIKPIQDMCRAVNFELYILRRYAMTVSEVAEKWFYLQPSADDEDSIEAQSKSIHAESQKRGNRALAKVTRDDWTHLGVLTNKIIHSKHTPLVDRMQTAFAVVKEAWTIRDHAMRWDGYLRQFSHWIYEIATTNTKRHAVPQSNNSVGPQGNTVICMQAKDLFRLFEKWDQGRDVGEHPKLQAIHSNTETILSQLAQNHKETTDSLSVLHEHVEGVPRMVAEAEDAMEKPREIGKELYQFARQELSEKAQKLFFALPECGYSVNAAAKQTRVPETTARRIFHKEIVPFYEKHHWVFPQMQNRGRRKKVYMGEAQLSAEVGRGHVEPTAPACYRPQCESVGDTSTDS